MSIEFLISTTNRANLYFLAPMFEKILETNYKILVINQCYTIEPPKIADSDRNIAVISVKEKGLSKSRNRALQNATADICVIADDDLVYLPHTVKTISEAYTREPDVDVAIFQVQTPAGKPYKKYRNVSFELKRPWDQLRVSSVEITFKRKSVLEKGIAFNENLGLGAKYTAGEETRFIHDCVKSGLNVKCFPIPIVEHPIESSGKVFNKENVIAKGIAFATLFPLLFLPLELYFAIKWFPRYKGEYSFIKFLSLLFKGNWLVFSKKI